MSAAWPPEEPFVVQVGESEVDSPTDEPLDDGAEEQGAFEGQEARKRASAAAAYGKAVHHAPRKPVAKSGDAEVAGAADQEVSTDEAQPQIQDVEELAAKAELADEYLLLAQRTQADFENYRKRAARDAALAQDRGMAKLAKELLPAIDNLERAVQAAEAFASVGGLAADSGPSVPDPDPAAAADGKMLDGLKLVHAEVLAALSRAGIESFSPIGEQFDPQHHEAVAQHKLEGMAAGTVIEVYQQGYRLGDAVLRPARVLVAA